MKRLSVVCIWLLVFALCLSGIASAMPREFEWGTTKEQIVQEKGEPAAETELMDAVIDVCYIADTLTSHYLFKDNKLFREFYITGGIEQYDALTKEHTSLYGDETNDPYLFAANMEFMGLSKDAFENEEQLIKALQENNGVYESDIRFKSWNIDETNYVILMFMPILESGFVFNYYGFSDEIMK